MRSYFYKIILLCFISSSSWAGAYYNMGFFKKMGSGDPSINDVTMLLHLEGAEGSTAITNSATGGVASSFTTSGGWSLSASQKKFGTTGLSLSGATDAPTASVADGSVISNVATSSWTVELWVYWMGGVRGQAFCLRPSSAGQAYGFQIMVTDTGGIYFEWNYGPSPSSDYYSISTVSVVPVNTWTHLAVVNNAGVVTVYVAGQGRGTVNISAKNLISYNAVVIGAFKSGGGGTASVFPGSIDEVRVTNGIARYNSNFAVPVNPF